MKDRNIHKSHKKLLCVLAIAFIALVVCFYVTITKSGHWLVEDDDFKHVKWAVILDGQSADLERNDYVAKLMNEQKIDSVMILGRRVYREKSNADFYAEDFLKLGNFDKGAIFIARHDDPSTLTEAQTIIPWLKLHNIDTVLLVTAAPATTRAAKIFRSLSGEKPVYVTADIHHHQYNAESWFFNRESRKSWLHEWAALFNFYFDIFGSDTLAKAEASYAYRIRSITDEEMDEPIIDLQQLLPKKDSAKENTKNVDDTENEDNDSDEINADEPKKTESTEKAKEQEQ